MEDSFDEASAALSYHRVCPKYRVRNFSRIFKISNEDARRDGEDDLQGGKYEAD